MTKNLHTGPVVDFDIQAQDLPDAVKALFEQVQEDVFWNLAVLQDLFPGHFGNTHLYAKVENCGVYEDDGNTPARGQRASFRWQTPVDGTPQELENFRSSHGHGTKSVWQSFSLEWRVSDKQICRLSPYVDFTVGLWDDYRQLKSYEERIRYTVPGFVRLNESQFADTAELIQKILDRNVLEDQVKATLRAQVRIDPEETQRRRTLCRQLNDQLAGRDFPF